jgi:hypothetical protein
MTNTQAKVAIEKSEHPERFCPARRCLWRTAKLDHAAQTYSGGGYCPRHQRREKSTAMDRIRNGLQFPSGQQ